MQLALNNLILDILGHSTHRIDLTRLRMCASITSCDLLQRVIIKFFRVSNHFRYVFFKICVKNEVDNFSFQTQSNQEHSHSTQASPTNTLKHVKRQRARSADESNKNLLSPRDNKQSDENWVSVKSLVAKQSDCQSF